MLSNPSAWTGVPLPVAKRAALARSVREAVSVYFAGSFQDWERWRTDGLHRGSSQEPELSETAWSSRLRILRSSRPQWERLKLASGESVMARMPIRSDQTKAVAIPDDPHGAGDTTAQFDPLKVEVQVPIIGKASDGAAIERLYGMTFQQRRSDGQWIVTGHAFIGPSSAGLVIPP